MTCPHCGNTKDWTDLEDGRSRCVVCFATFEKAKVEKVEKAEASGKRARSRWEKA